MSAARIKAENALNAIAADIPLIDRQDLSILTAILERLENLASQRGLPRAFKAMATRAAKLAGHVIMAETDFDDGVKKLGECIAKMARGLSPTATSAGNDAVEHGETEAAEDQEDVGAAAEGSAGGQEEGLADDVKELLVKFASQQRTVLEDFEAYVLEMEKGTPQALDAIRRILHTWKGEFGVLDLQDYARLMHSVEELFEGGGISTDALLKLKDFLVDRTSRFVAGSIVRVSDADRASILGSEQPARGGKIQRPAGADCTSANDECVPTSGEHAFEGDPTLMGDFVTESRDHIHTAESLLLELETDPSNPDYINSIFRSCHTIKGVAGFLGLRDVSALAHSMENVMDLARRGELQLQSGHIDLLLESMDCLKELVALIEDAMCGGDYRLPGSYAVVLDRLSSPYEIAGSDQCGGPGTRAPRVGEILVQRGEISEERLEEALRRQQEGDKRRIGEILIGNGETKARAVGSALASQNASKLTRVVEETIRVPVERLDALVDAIGEAVIAQSMIAADTRLLGAENQNLAKKITQANMIMRSVQELSMSLRMVSIKSTFQKMARLVRDLSKKSGKDIEFVMEGEDTELDKSVVENIGDPLIHMIRNAIDHGIEDSIQERLRAAKSARATVILRAFHKAGNIYIEITDDGRGLDREAIFDKAVKQGLCREEEKLSDQEVYEFIFRPGFSTARKITDVSGRGVGMDVVRRNIQSLRGSIEIQSEKGKGTSFSIRLPLTLAIIDGMVVRLGQEQFILPTLSILESLQFSQAKLESVLKKGEVIDVRGQLIKLIRLAHLFGTNGRKAGGGQEGIVILVEDMLGRAVALLVDEILGQQQVVIKSLGQGIGEMPGVSGGAIMGDGSVSLILDIGGLVKIASE